MRFSLTAFTNTPPANPRADCFGSGAAHEHLAIAGDGVYLDPACFTVNGRIGPNFAAMRKDTQGVLVPHIAYAAYVLRDHQVWLIGDDMRSFDSR